MIGTLDASCLSMTNTLCEETSWKRSDEYSLYREAICITIEDDGLVPRIG